MRRRLITIFMLLIAQQSLAQPRLVYRFDRPISDVFFLGSPGPTQVGFVGTYDGNINRTSDGGQTWNVVFTANTGQVVTSFTFKDSLEGWASANTTFIHTSDGGKTWQTFLINSTGGATIHYEASSGYLFAGDNSVGEFYSSDLGNTWLPNTRGEPNVVGDSEIVTITGFIDNITAISTDGGITWDDVHIPYGFPVGFEDDLFSFGPNRLDTVFFSSDLGLTWQRRGVIPDFDCDGECCEWGNLSTNNPSMVLGYSGAIYTLDAEFAIFVSTDTGWTWQAICLPRGAHNNSTQEICWTLCEPVIYLGLGQELFILPDRPMREGLSITEGPNPLVRDTCTNTSAGDYIMGMTGYCAQIEQIFLTGSAAWTLEAGQSGIFTNDTDYYALHYYSSHIGYDTAALHIRYDMVCKNETHDTTITLFGETRGSQSLNLRLDPSVVSGSAGDTVEFVLRTDSLDALYSLRSLDFSLSYDTNLITYIGGDNGRKFHIPVVWDSNGIIAKFRFKVYLTTTDSTELTLSDLVINSSDSFASSCLSVQAVTLAKFDFVSRCGNPTIRNFMEGIPLSLSVQPNPSSGQVTISLRGQRSNSLLTIENSIGEIVYRGWMMSDQETIPMDNWSDGVYFVRVGNLGGRFVKQ